MAEPVVEHIVKRIRHLSSLVSSSGLDEDKKSGLSGRQLIGQEGLLDALLVLYDECNTDQLKKEKKVAAFVDKYRSTVHDLRKFRVNLNDFEQKKVIGKGHFGVVQVVREKATGNVFALKSLRKSDTLSLQHVAFYEEERDIMAKATSPWITQLQYAFQDDQQLYLVMDFHPGGDLLSLLDRYDGSFSEDMTCFYLAEIILALHALHSMCYVHRDIKPDNILIDRCGHIKLADFGSAAKLSSSGVVRSKIPVGTPDYIAPEVLQSVNEKAGSVSYGTECDWWSLGIMAYEMCYGFTPFKGDKVTTTYSNIMNHKKMLKFEDDDENPVSELAKDVIRGLLEDSNHRLTHLALLQHKFFLHVNWNDLRNTPPPFVPVVNGIDDTSNFEEFENERRLPCVDAFRVPQGFTGKNLPFVGFTYNRKQPDGDGSSSRGSAVANISVLDETIREPSHLEAQLKAQKKENHELRLQLESLKDGEIGHLMKAKDCKLKEAECRVEYIEKERQRLEDVNVQKERAAASYKRDLALERADRAKIESQTIELIRSMKNNWKKSEAEKLETLSNKVTAYEEEIAFLESQHKEVGKALLEREKEFRLTMAENAKLKNALQEKEKQAVHNQQENRKNRCIGNCQIATETKAKVEEMAAKLKRDKEKNSSVTVQLEGAMKQISELEKSLSEKAHVEEERKLVDKQLKELQKKFTELEVELTASEKKFQEAKEQEQLEKKKLIDHLEVQLVQEKKECGQLRRQLQEISGQLNESVASFESLSSNHSLKEEEQESKIKELEHELKNVASDKVNLQSQLTLIKNKEGEHKSKIAELEKLLSKLSETVNSLESKKSSTQAFEETYQAKLELLETQLESVRTAHSQDKEKVTKISEELREAKQELSDSKLDVRVGQRELKSAQDTISYLREKNREQRSLHEEKELTIQKAAEGEADLKKNIDHLRKEIEGQKMEMVKQRSDHELFVSNLEEKIRNLEDGQKSLENLQKQLRQAHQQADTYKIEKRGLESQIKIMETVREEVKQEKVAIQEDVSELQKKLQHSEMVISQLKELCSDQDEELSIMESLSEKITQHEQEEVKLQQEIEKLKVNVREAKASVNEEKSLKLFQEKKVKELGSRLSVVDKETDEQIVHLNNQLKESGKMNLELHEQIETLDKELSEAMVLIRNLERRSSEVQGQCDLAKQEADGHIQHIHTLKESNFRLTEGLEEAICKAELYKKNIEDMEHVMADHEALYEDSKVKMKCTIDQQTKLIDFLQAKTDSKKKKNLKGKLFGGKENKENTGFSMPHQYRELEDLLARQRMINKQLEEQLAKSRAEIVALRANGGASDSKSVMGTPRTSRTPLLPCTPLPSHSTLPPRTPQNKRTFQNVIDSPYVQESTSKQRMRHNIPHRWQSGLQMRAARCSGCLGSIPFARNAARCQECGIIAHSKCSLELPSTCGLPVQFAEHYSRGWTRDSPVKVEKLQLDSDILIQGSLKMPKTGKSFWESYFVRLENEEIQVYEHEPVSGMQPLSRFSLSRSGCCTTIISAIPRSELPNITSVDLPYVLKIEVLAKSVPANLDNLYLMTTNFEEKQSWVSTLEGVVAELQNKDDDKSSLTDYIQLNTLLSMDNPSPLDVCTAVFLNKTTAVVGAAEGLYSFEIDKNGKLKSRARIEGLSAVHQILLVEKAAVALFISGKDNLVYMKDIGSLTVAAEAMQLTKPSLSPVRVEPLQGCHLLASGSTKCGQIFVCASATDRISILLWNDLEEKFAVCRQYSTQEPCSCLHFTQASLIVGAEKFYEIDLKTFDIEEFLDESDTTLAYAIYGSAQMSSFPVAILQVSKPGKYEEYLLCFHEFAVFVDPCGQRSREHDIKFTRLPIAIVFQNPYLYVIHQNAVEVIEIRPDSYTKVSGDIDSDSDSSLPVRIAAKNIARPSYLGPASTPESIIIASRSSDHLELVQVSSNFPDDMDFNSTWDTLPAFSLDRNENNETSVCSTASGSSLEIERNHSSKRVQFRQASQASCKRSKCTP